MKNLIRTRWLWACLFAGMFVLVLAFLRVEVVKIHPALRAAKKKAVIPLEVVPSVPMEVPSLPHDECPCAASYSRAKQ